jgi:hypothetical protein
MQRLIFSCCIVAGAFASNASAQPVAEVPGAVALFDRICLGGGIDPAARAAALDTSGWQQDATADVDVQKLGISKSIDRNYDFTKAESTSQWSGLIDDRPARIVLASFPEKRRYRHLCTLVIDDVANAMPYADPLKAAFKSFGIGGKSVDLVHYFEFAGKLGPEKHPARGEIFTRSLASGGKNSMHIYVAY